MPPEGIAPMRRAAGILGAIICLLAVALGAFGAHGLRDRLPPESLAVYLTGAQYQFLHGLALVALAAAAPLWPSRAASAAAVLFTAGVLVFSGSLYALTLTGITRFGMITPVGGVAFMAGWVALAAAWWNAPGGVNRTGVSAV